MTRSRFENTLASDLTLPPLHPPPNSLLFDAADNLRSGEVRYVRIVTGDWLGALENPLYAGLERRGRRPVQIEGYVSFFDSSSDANTDPHRYLRVPLYPCLLPDLFESDYHVLQLFRSWTT